MSMNNVEVELGSLIDYLCSYAVKNNEVSTGIALVKGGKAVNEYLEKRNNYPSYDWDMTFYSKIDDCEKLCKMYVNSIQNLYDNYLAVAKITVKSALNAEFGKRPGTPKVQFIYNKRTSNISNIKVHSVFMEINGYGRIVIVEMTHSDITDSEYNSLISAKKCDQYLPNHILDTKRRFVSLDYLVEDLELITSPASTYPKKHKALNRLQLLQSGILNRSLNAYIYGDKYDRIVYDATGSFPHFNSWKNVPDAHIQRDVQLIINNRPSYAAVIDYTMDYSVNQSLIKAYYFNDNNLITPAHKKNMDDIDACFDFHNSQPIINFPTPVNVFRLTKYIDPPRRGENDQILAVNLYNLQSGDVLPCITVTSTTYENKRESSGFNQESQFRGCVFIIKLKSSEGVIVVDSQSHFPNEKEIILDRRGALKIKKVSFDYVTEKCKNLVFFAERMVVHCKFIPYKTGRSILLTKFASITKSVAIDVKEFDTSRYNDNDVVLTPWLSPLSHRQARDMDIEAYKANSLAGFCFVLNLLWKFNNDRRDDESCCEVKTVSDTLRIPSDLADLYAIPNSKIIDYKPQRLQISPFSQSAVFVGSGLGLHNMEITILVILILLLIFFFVFKKFIWKDDMEKN